MNENQPWYAHVAALISQGCSYTQAVDYYVVEIEGVPAEIWSGMRGTKTPRAVPVSVDQAKQALGEPADADDPEQQVIA